MDNHVIPSVVAALYSLLLAGVVIARNRRASVNRAFFLLLVTACVWQSGTIITLASSSAKTAEIGTKIGFLGIALIPVATYHLIFSFAALRKKRLLTTGYAIAIFVFIPLAIFSRIFNGVNHFPWGYYYRVGVLHPLFLLFFLFYSVLSFSTLIIRIRHQSSSVDRIRMKYVLIGLSIAYGGAVDFLPAYGVDIYPISFIFLIIAVTIFFYAIVRYHLMDIRFIVKKTLVYSLTAAMITAIFVVLVLSVLRLMSPFLEGGSFGVYLFSALLIAFLASPIKAKVQKLVDRIFYRKSYSYYPTVQMILAELSSKTEIKDICLLVLNTLKQSLGISGGHFFIRDDNLFTLVCSEGATCGISGNGAEATSLPYSSEIVRLLEYKKDIVLMGETSFVPAPFDRDALRSQIGTFGAETVVPLFLEKSLEGILFLNPKMSGEALSWEDMNLLRTVAPSTALSLRTALMYAEKIRSEKFATIGVMAAALAHEIKNPLSSIKTFSELLPEKYNSDAEFREVYARIIPEEVCRIDNLATELLMFSRQPSGDNISTFDLCETTNDILTLFSARLNQAGIKVSKNFQEKLFIKADRDRMKQALINLVSNSLQAMPDGGTLAVSVEREGGLITIYIRDSGRGIKETHIPHIFEPFHTTRDGGFGLGLAVSKKIIEDYGGSIKVASKEHLGTTYTVTFKDTAGGNGGDSGIDSGS